MVYGDQEGWRNVWDVRNAMGNVKDDSSSSLGLHLLPPHQHPEPRATQNTDDDTQKN